MSAKQQMLDYLIQHVGEMVPGEVLRKIAGTSDWARALRLLRQEGWDLETVQRGIHSAYRLNSRIKGTPIADISPISTKLRAMILERDRHRCTLCGVTSKQKGVRLHVDHIIPRDWGGPTKPWNLTTLCGKCNEGKKDLFSGFSSPMLRHIPQQAKGELGNLIGRILEERKRNLNDLEEDIAKLSDYLKKISQA